MKRTFALLTLVLTAAAVLFYSAPAPSFVPELTNGTRDHWIGTPAAPTYRINPAHGANVTGTTDVRTVINTAFQTWTSAPNTTLGANNGGDTTQVTIGNDGVNVICFTCTPPGGFGKDGTLAVTLTTTNNTTGAILDADIVFNTTVKFITDSTPAPSGSESLATVAVHEIGHFFGLDHSGIVRSIMFPQAPSLQTALSYDDVIGISTNYPSLTPTVPTSNISGTIRNAAGADVFGAHVFAESTTTATPFGNNVRKSPIGTLSRPDGTYQITVPADTYTVTAEPADQPFQNSDVDWAKSFGQTALVTNFTTRQH